MDPSAADAENRKNDGELTFPVVVLALLERRRLLIGFGLVGIAWGVFDALRKPTHYSVQMSFMASPKRGVSAGTSALGGLAAQLGISGVGDQGSQNSYYYADVVKSRTILETTALHDYNVVRDGVKLSGKLPKMLEIEADSATAIEKAIEELRVMVGTAVNVRTGVVSVKTTADAPELALQISTKLLTALEAFNTTSRQTQAAAERQFIEKRVSDMLGELRTAESAQQTFVTHNRDIGSSPALRLELDRLEREVMLRQQVYSVLVSAYEQARIDQLRDTPLLTVIDRPTMPVLRDPKGRVTLVIGHTLLLLMVGIGYVAYRTARERSGLLGGPDWDKVRLAIRKAVGRGPKS